MSRESSDMSSYSTASPSSTGVSPRRNLALALLVSTVHANVTISAADSPLYAVAHIGERNALTECYMAVFDKFLEIKLLVSVVIRVMNIRSERAKEDLHKRHYP
jgi:hypothetical protein